MHRPALDIVNTIEVISPCLVPWETMHGDERVRSCDRCQRQVFDLTEMSTAEAAAILEVAKHRPCVRFYRKRDGRIMIADGSAGLRGAIWRRLRRHIAWAASLFSFLFFPGCHTQGVPVRRIKPHAVSVHETVTSPGESSPHPPLATEGG